MTHILTYTAATIRFSVCLFLFFQAEVGIRYLVRSRGLGDVYKRQLQSVVHDPARRLRGAAVDRGAGQGPQRRLDHGALSLIHI